MNFMRLDYLSYKSLIYPFSILNLSGMGLMELFLVGYVGKKGNSLYCFNAASCYP